MADFLTRAACNGAWPKGLLSSALRSRPELVSKLMRERNVARFVVAPDGFGKSTLAAEYADVVFSFEHVFWIDCRSPCFLRDLDNESLGRAINRKDARVSLVVFDRVPLLDETRAQAFSQLADRLLSQSCEVIATMPPSSDVFSGLHRDRICLFAHDLLLSDEELREEQSLEERIRTEQAREAEPERNPEERPGYGTAGERAALPSRIPSIAWGRDGGQALLRGLTDDDLPARLRAWLFSALALQQGNVNDKRLFIPLGDDDLETIAVHYPFVEIERDSGDFLAIPIDPETLMRCFSAQLPSYFSLMGLRDAEEFAVTVGDLSLHCGRISHACRFLLAAGQRTTRERWLAENGLGLLAKGALDESCRLFASVPPRRSSTYLDACAVHAWRLALLGKREDAVGLGRRVALSPYSTEEARICTSLLLAGIGEEECRPSAESALCALMGIPQDTVLSAEELYEHAHRTDHPCNPFWRSLACVQLSLRTGCTPAQEMWKLLRSRKAPEDALIAGACRLVREHGARACPDLLEYLQKTIARRFSPSYGYCEDDGAAGGFAALHGEAFAGGAGRENYGGRELWLGTDALRGADEGDGFGGTGGSGGFGGTYAGAWACDARECDGFDLFALFAANAVEHALRTDGMQNSLAYVDDVRESRIEQARAKYAAQKRAIYGAERRSRRRRRKPDCSQAEAQTERHAASDAARSLPFRGQHAAPDIDEDGGSRTADADTRSAAGAMSDAWNAAGADANRAAAGTANACAGVFAGAGAGAEAGAADAGIAAPPLYAVVHEAPPADTLQSVVPALHVKLFGGMDVSLGGHTLTDVEFRRSKSKTLLALLVLAEGHVITRDKLARMLWDSGTTPEHCMKRNLYSVWSQLRRTLTLPDGSCPYVMKQQGGYRADMRYVISDVTRANELCRSAALRREGSLDAQSLLDGYYQVFAGGLLPDEASNKTIIQMRKDYKKRLVNALLSASSSLSREGRPEDALCYAICAFDTDQSREDVYLALMSAQHAAGQRDQAIETYFACRRYLSTELGIDPSPDTEKLYMKILTNE